MIKLIVAHSSNFIIGNDNKLLWDLKDDLKIFKKLTTNNDILMGRKTYQSIGKCLPNRTNIILTRDKNFKLEEPGIVVNSIEHGIAKHNRKNDLYIIGGQNVYDQTIKYADELYITEVDCILQGDASFNHQEYIEDNFNLLETNIYHNDTNNEYDFTVKHYRRKNI
jgi:dihydrofolate reductase